MICAANCIHAQTFQINSQYGQAIVKQRISLIDVDLLDSYTVDFVVIYTTKIDGVSLHLISPKPLQVDS